MPHNDDLGVAAGRGFAGSDYQAENRALVKIFNDLRKCGAEEHIKVCSWLHICDYRSSLASVTVTIRTCMWMQHIWLWVRRSDRQLCTVHGIIYTVHSTEGLLSGT